MPRVLVLGQPPVVEDLVEHVEATDGIDAVARVDAEPFDAVLVDLSLPPLDGWMVLSELGHRAERPRIIVTVVGVGEVERALALGADLCVRAGTTVHARALASATNKEPACRPSRETNSRSPKPSGAAA